MQKSIRIAGIATAALTLMVVTACSSGGGSTTSTTTSNSASAPAETNVTIELTPVPPNFLQYVASTEGFFKKNNLNVTYVPIATSATALAAISAGSVDIISSSPEPFIPAISKGLQIEAVSSEDTSPWYLVANNSIPVTSGSLTAQLDELKGKTLGVSAFGSSTDFVTQQIMSLANLPYPGSYSIAAVGNAHTALPAIETNRIQAIVTAQPTVDQVLAAHDGHIVATFGASPPLDHPNQLMMFASTSWVSQNPQGVMELNKALAQAYVWASNPSNLAAAEKIFTSLVGTSSIPNGYLESLVKAQISESQPWISPSQMELYDQFDVKFGTIKSAVPLSQLLAPGVPASRSAALALANSGS